MPFCPLTEPPLRSEQRALHPELPPALAAHLVRVDGASRPPHHIPLFFSSLLSDCPMSGWPLQEIIIPPPKPDIQAQPITYLYRSVATTPCTLTLISTAHLLIPSPNQTRPTPLPHLACRRMRALAGPSGRGGRSRGRSQVRSLHHRSYTSHLQDTLTSTTIADGTANSSRSSSSCRCRTDR